MTTNSSNITPAKLAQVAAMVAAQKAKASQTGGKKNGPVISGRDQAEIDAKKAQLIAERDARKLVRAENRAQKLAALETLRTERKLAREAKKAERLANLGVDASTPSHQRKLERLQNNLPELSENLMALQSSLTNFSDVELTSALAYVEFERRQRAIKSTAEVKGTKVLSVGDKVRITNCSTRKFIGQEGVVSMVRRVRAFVTVPGFDTDAYIWLTDAEVLEPATAIASEAEVQTLDITEPETTEVYTDSEETDEAVAV